jgi:hypothetical protein
MSEILGFRTLSIVQVLKDKTKEEYDVSETEDGDIQSPKRRVLP